MSVIEFMFNLDRGKTYHILTSPQAKLLQEFIAKWADGFPSISVASVRMKQFQDHCLPELLALTSEILDEFYRQGGEMYRGRYQVLYMKEKKEFVPSLELFFGLYVPSEIWPQEDVRIRGAMMPFLTLYVYQQAIHETNIKAMIGRCKEITVQSNQNRFPYAAQAGFVGGPPERAKFYHAYHWLQKHFSLVDHDVSVKLARNGIMNLTVASSDCMNVPVDPRDQTGSVGTGSRGSFYGYKESTTIAGNCIPIFSTLGDGRAYDSTLFPDVFWETMNLTTTTMIDLWVWTLDAAYNNPTVIDLIELEGKIPLIDLNPRNSHLLKSYKLLVNDLAILSKKAIGVLTKKDRKRWEAELEEFSKAHGGQVSFQEKKRYMRVTLENLANKARKLGLSSKERREEQKLRRKVRIKRQEIERKGTAAEKKAALQCLIHGTMEWFLVYGIRGQNEGFYGIAKKRNNLIGDGQHTTWVIGHSKIEGKTAGMITAIKCVAWIRFVVTGDRQGMLCILVNWRHKRVFYLSFFVVIFCRHNPITNS
jgi:hypothetical protein